jgi:hypothetical protein
MKSALKLIGICAIVGSVTFPVWSQSRGTIRGVVIDSLTNEPLPFTNVFINNTTIGTSSNLDGTFRLDDITLGFVDVVFSYVGYQSRIIRFHIYEGADLEIGTIALLQKEEQLEEVHVKAKRDKDWERKFRNFEKFLLGANSTASCKIQNPWVIEFSENSSKTSIEASADEAIEIHNYGLGYKIYFYMSAFSANPSSYRIVGQFRFEEAQPLDESQAIRWKQNRIETYHGSERHLFKSLIEGRASEEGFRLFQEKPGYTLASRSNVFNVELDQSVIEYDTKDIVTRGNSPDQFFISFPPRVEVHYVNEYATRKYYKDIPFQVSWLEVENGQVEVNSNGVAINSADLVSSGVMSNARVADLLPRDYKPYIEVGNVKIHPVARLTGWSKYKRMQEFTYVQTDKPYYYPGERIWLKAYMQYRDYELVDSLSKVLYVELINDEKVCIDRKYLSIDSGSAVGHIDLPDSTLKGNYYLRAYTQWMRNYGSESFYVRPLAVLGLTDKVMEEKVEYDTASLIVHFTSHKETYTTRDSIRISIEVKDQQGFPVDASLSASVTDAVLIKAIPGQPTILNFNLPDERMSVNQDFRVRFPAEKGIQFSGIFKDDRGKPQRTNLSITQRNFNSFIPAPTDANGEFKVTGLNFTSTLHFGFQALTKRGKPYGQITLNEKDFPLIDFESRPLHVKIQDMNVVQVPVTTYIPGKDTRLLENVIVKGTSLEDFDPRTVSIYGKPDFVVQGEELKEVFTGNNLIQALQGKVPGLRVTYGWDENNMDTYRVRLRGGSSTMGVGFTSVEPILIVDGIPFGGGPNESIANYLTSIPTQTVERVEIITSAVPLFGLRGANGAILIFTKNSKVTPEVSTVEDDPNMQVIPVRGYEELETFKGPTYESGESSQSADLRSTIHWEPNLKAKDGHAKFSFYSADLQELYRVVVEGLSGDGRIVRGEYKIKIENP